MLAFSHPCLIDPFIQLCGWKEQGHPVDHPAVWVVTMDSKQDRPEPFGEQMACRVSRHGHKEWLWCYGLVDLLCYQILPRAIY